MKRLYTQPELDVKSYRIAPGRYITTSDPENNEKNDLNTDDNYNYFGGGNP